MSGPRELDAIAARLREIAERLKAEDIESADADELAREAADLVTTADRELDRATDPGTPD